MQKVMKSLRNIALFTISFLTFSIVNAQNCDSMRFTEMPVFTNIEVDSTINVVYGTAVNWLGISEDLQSNIYYPKFDLDTLEKRPFILLLHGGSFLIKL